MYKPVQKKNSSWTPTTVQKKGKSPEKLGHFSIQPKSNPSSTPSQEIGEYSRASADRLAANVMRGIQAKEQEQAEGSTLQSKSASPWAPTFDAPPPLAQSPASQLCRDAPWRVSTFAPVSENPIQRQCADCAKEEKEQAGEAGKDLEEIGIQTKLTIGAPGDTYEQEADRVASQVMSMSAPPDSSASVQRQLDTNHPHHPNQIWQRAQSITPVVQRQIDPRVQMRQMIQRAHQIDGNQASGDLESRLNSSKGGGSPLSEGVRGFMEPRFGADFSGVRVHTGGEAVQMNRELGAQAFTHGSDVYFGAGKSPGNNELTAHELTHVVQQTQSIQRELTDEQKQMDLKSPRFAGNQRLQNTYDNSPVMKKGETGDAVKLLQQALIDQGFPMPISTGGGTQPPDGIFGNETFATVQKFQNQHDLGVDGIVGRQTLGKLDELNAVPQPQPPTQVTPTIEPQPDGQILGSAQATRAKAKFEQLSNADKTKFVELLQQAGSEAERQYLYKALAAGHPIVAIDTFATRIRGQDAQWLQDHLRLTGSTTGTGIQQQWSHSCNATTVQAVQGELDPIYALQVHDDNPNFGQVDDADATHFNPNLAEQQRSMLESTYTGTKFGSHSGVAANRGNAAGGSGRWADDLLNSLSASTGVQYTPQIIGTDITLDQAITRIDSALIQGIPVPIVIGNGPNQFTHYVLMTSKSDGPPKTYTIHDPWSAQTLTKTEDELKNGTLNIAGSNQMTEMEDPSVVP